MIVSYAEPVTTKGQLTRAPQQRPPVAGWHWREWGPEFTGTALLMFAVISATYWAVRAGVSVRWVRILVVGLVAGAVVLAIALSPLGHRSGAHLNTAVTLAMWFQRTVSRADFAGYLLAQSVGALTGFAAERAWGMRWPSHRSAGR